MECLASPFRRTITSSLRPLLQRKQHWSFSMLYNCYYSRLAVLRRMSNKVSSSTDIRRIQHRHHLPLARTVCPSHRHLQYAPPFQLHHHHYLQQYRSMMARSSGPSDETPFDKAVTFIINIGYDSALAHDMVQTLQDAGLSGEDLLATARTMAGRWEVGEDAGLEALAATIKAERATKAGRAMVKVWVVPPNAWESHEVENDNDAFTNLGQADMLRAFPVTAVEGTTLTDVAKFGIGEGASTLGEYMECACSGIMACSTCHVVVEPGNWFDKVGPPSEAEQDMLDLAYGPRETSRLGCQIVLSKDLDGLVIRLPAGANNIMDDIPFKD